MPNYSKSAFAVALTATLALSSPALAGFIDFEAAPSLGLSDNDAVIGAYQPSQGVTFSGAVLEQIDENRPDGFLNDQLGERDAATGSPTPGLGTYFLRTRTDFSDRNPGDTFLSISYDNAETAASGEIWDIDGNTAQGSEQWTVVFSLSGTQVATLQSPEGTTNGAGSLDGLPWLFAYSGAAFDQIDFVFAGTKTTGIGLAFDNFRTDTVPVPATLGLLGLGLAGLGLAARRRKTA
ncbi:PEP-CTERM sorting domain-containing protein [Rhodovibrio sodomensis]|nr:PEP-CTERM sorting domain-containing protein [Rhodovibrio sodomensis]